MEKKLPKVFANNIEKEIDNNKKIYSTISKSDKNLENENINTNKINTQIQKEETQYIDIQKKINDIFNIKKYIYKIPVKITTNEEELITKIIGKNNQNIITIENKIIQISKIKNIEIYEEK